MRRFVPLFLLAALALPTVADAAPAMGAKTSKKTPKPPKGKKKQKQKQKKPTIATLADLPHLKGKKLKRDATITSKTKTKTKQPKPATFEPTTKLLKRSKLDLSVARPKGPSGFLYGYNTAAVPTQGLGYDVGHTLLGQKSSVGIVVASDWAVGSDLLVECRGTFESKMEVSIGAVSGDKGWSAGSMIVPPSRGGKRIRFIVTPAPTVVAANPRLIISSPNGGAAVIRRCTVERMGNL